MHAFTPIAEEGRLLGLPTVYPRYTYGGRLMMQMAVANLSPPRVGVEFLGSSLGFQSWVRCGAHVSRWL